MIKVTVRFGGEHVKTYKLDDEEIIVGRDPECTVHIDNLGVSRQHAKIEDKGGVFVLTDLASNNGTFVRGERITQYNLNHGDLFNIGKFELEVDLGKPRQAKVEKPKPVEDMANPELTLAVDAKEMEMMQRERASRLKAYIVYTAPSGRQEKQPIQKTTTVFGKARGADFPVAGWRVQQKHALLVRDNNGFRLICVSDKKPTMLRGANDKNWKRVDDERLNNGDVFKIGKNEFEFFFGIPASHSPSGK
ncbi:MAG: FHA domain-containing protein [Planctomycetota bacterium]|jgi:pSer/pThr/pTyr-binding forkhead associated (FHA) protein